MKVIVYQLLEALFEGLAAFAERAREHYAICPDCGRNRYRGEPCK